MALYTTPETRPPLDESFYAPTSDDLAFWMQQTYIRDPAALKHHIVNVQRKAYELYGYRCIRVFDFVHVNIARHFAYEQIMRLARKRPDALLLDIGCCFGHDTRKVVADGWPMDNIIASDLRKGYWDIGHELFRSSPRTFPVTFVEGDALDPGMIAPRAPFYLRPNTFRPALGSLTSLTPLQGHLSAVHACLLFHVFSEAQQRTLACRLASLLAPHAGATIFGAHAARPQTGVRREVYGSFSVDVFCFSPKDWVTLWDGEMFEKGTVRVETEITVRERADLVAADNEPFHLMVWSVTRL